MGYFTVVDLESALPGSVQGQFGIEKRLSLTGLHTYCSVVAIEAHGSEAIRTNTIDMESGFTIWDKLERNVIFLLACA